MKLSFVFESKKEKTMETETSNKYSVLMLEKGMGVLELLADYHSGLTIQEMCSHLSYPKTTIYRLANTLLEMGYLGKDEDTNHFFPSAHHLCLCLVDI